MTGFETFALAAAAGATVLGEAKSISQGEAQAREAASQADFLRNQAAYQAQLAQSQEARLRQNQSRQLAQMRALLAGRGVDIAAGSPLLTQQQAAADAEFQALLLRSTGADQTAVAQQQATLAGLKADAARTNAWLGTGSSLLTAGSTLADTYEKIKKLNA
jgi:hypothetical protein